MSYYAKIAVSVRDSSSSWLFRADSRPFDGRLGAFFGGKGPDGEKPPCVFFGYARRL